MNHYTKITADYIFPISTPPLRNGVIVYDQSGVIEKVVAAHDFNGSWDEVKKYQGIIVPGFINSHTHLELSHLRGSIPEKQGLPRFIKQVQAQRLPVSSEDFAESMQAADATMKQNGIVAAGDISNVLDSFSVKQHSRIHYYTFFERFGFDPDTSRYIFNEVVELKETCEREYNLPASPCPHAPYSTSTELIRLISDYCDQNTLAFSIHNQESNEENRMFRNKSGSLYDQLLQFGVLFDHWHVPGISSLQAIATFLPEKANCLLVHNTFTDEQDIKEVTGRRNNIYWVLAPNANQYIENTLPPIQLLRKHRQTIAIGTDSYASNQSLSILDELKTIHKAFPDIPLDELLLWATLNGARALGYENRGGSFEPGKTPGINLLQDVDLQTLILSEKSKVCVIV